MSRKHLFLSLAVALPLMSGHAAELGPEAAQAEPAAPSTVFPTIDVVQVDYAGTGCPPGSASAVVVPNWSELLLIFDRNTSRTSHGQSTDYTNCNLVAYLRVPAGYRISVRGFEYHGWADIPLGGDGLLHAQYSGTAGVGYHTYTTRLPGGLQGDWMRDEPHPDAGWSSCGGEVVAYASIDLAVRKPSAWSSDDARLVLDTIGYSFDWDYC